MNIQAWMKREGRTGLVFTTLELCEWTQKAGHVVSVRQPGEDDPVAGPVLTMPDVHTIHSQISPTAFYDDRPKFMWMHGEPLSSVGNGVSMKAIVDLAPLCEAFICMRKQEHPIWNRIKRTFLVPKGIDLEAYKPLPGLTERLSGEPAVLYYENMRGQRNPLYILMAMAEVWKKLPKARLHLYNFTNKQMHETFVALNKHCKFFPFLRSIQGAVGGIKEVNMLLNRVDIVASGLHPLYARSIECFGAGKPLVCPGYREHDDYPYTCELEVHSIANAIIKAWEERGKFDARKWAERHHNIVDTVEQSVATYSRYL